MTGSAASRAQRSGRLGRAVKRARRLALQRWRRRRQALVRWWRPSVGARGERAAARYLRRLGYHIVERNVRTRYSELDLVAVDGRTAQGRTVVFVEVKTLVAPARYHPAEMVDRDKQLRLTRAALAFLKRHGLLEHPARFDVVAVIWPAHFGTPQVEHFQNAFEPIGQGQMFI